MTTTNSSEPFKRLCQEIDTMPDRVKLTTRQGFQIATTLVISDRVKLIELMFKSFERDSTSLDVDLFASQFPNLTRRDIGRLVTALSIIFGLLTQNEVTAKEFVEAARSNILDEVNEPTVLVSVRELCESLESVGIEGLNL